jgi:hypothetical protein
LADKETEVFHLQFQLDHFKLKLQFAESGYEELTKVNNDFREQLETSAQDRRLLQVWIYFFYLISSSSLLIGKNHLFGFDRLI